MNSKIKCIFLTGLMITTILTLTIYQLLHETSIPLSYRLTPDQPTGNKQFQITFRPNATTCFGNAENKTTVSISPNLPLVMEMETVQCSQRNSGVPKSTPKRVIVWLNVPLYFIRTQISFNGCPIANCVLTVNKSLLATADAVLAHGVNMPRSDFPRASPDQIWIFFGWEPPFHYDQVYRQKNWLGRFNWTMTYRFDSDITWPYGYLLEDPTQEGRHLDHENLLDIAHNKSGSVVWFVSNCNSHNRRGKYVEELQKYIHVDIYGRCGPKKCGRTWHDCIDLLSSYRFYLSFENSLCKDYITEKLFKVYSGTAIPVVRGGADYEALLPKGTYIDADSFKSPKELAEYLLHLETHSAEYLEILERKSKYRNMRYDEMGPYRWPCILCAKLHSFNETKVIPDIHAWLHDDMCYKATDI